MSQLFIQQLMLSVVVAGVWITLATVLSEKLGSRLGGMIGNLPSTIFTSLLFIGITQSPDFAAEATVSVPLGMFLSTMFLFLFISLVHKGILFAVVVGLSAWVLLALVFSFFQDASMVSWLVLYVLGAVFTYFLAEKVQNIPSQQKVVRNYSSRQLVFRALFAGSVVGCSVLIAHAGSTFWAGIMASFPAMMLSSMVILSLSAGQAFAKATGKIMLLASTNIVLYSLVAGLLFPLVGIWMGTLAAYAASVTWVWFLKPVFDRGR
ncbi:MAG: DUF3147 family protein [Bacteroidales bacterium]|nr:DUF3147 family protein [Bacteroidales bacterium]